MEKQVLVSMVLRALVLDEVVWEVLEVGVGARAQQMLSVDGHLLEAFAIEIHPLYWYEDLNH